MVGSYCLVFVLFTRLGSPFFFFLVFVREYTKRNINVWESSNISFWKVKRNVCFWLSIKKKGGITNVWLKAIQQPAIYYKAFRDIISLYFEINLKKIHLLCPKIVIRGALPIVYSYNRISYSMCGHIIRSGCPAISQIKQNHLLKLIFRIVWLCTSTFTCVGLKRLNCSKNQRYTSALKDARQQPSLSQLLGVKPLPSDSHMTVLFTLDRL